MTLSVRLDDVLPPGIAAELAAWLPRLPLGVETAPAGAGVWWGCEVALPPVSDPQTPACVFALARFLDDDVPARIAASTGKALAHDKPRSFAVRVWRKGSFADEAAGAPGTVDAILGLTGARWPAAWGGALEVGGERRPPGWDTLDLLDGASPRAVTLLTRHVAVVTIVATYT
jgi:hypothetical protein